MSNDSAPDVPDAISSDQLRSLLHQSTRDEPFGIVGEKVPVLPLGSSDAGAADLLLASQQLLRAAGGASILQLLHAGCYILSVAVEMLDHQLEGLRNERVSPADIIFLGASRSISSSIKSCVTLVQGFLGPLTAFHAQANHSTPGSRKAVISDGALTALGIDVSAYDVEFVRHVKPNS